MICRPLNLIAHLRPPPRNFDALFYVNVACVGLLFALFGSRFVLAKGMAIDPPNLPAEAQSAMTTGVVVNMQRDNLILFEGGRYSLPAFQQKLGEYVKEHGPVRLLLRIDKQASVQGFVAIAAAATSAGCPIQVAAEASGPQP